MKLESLLLIGVGIFFGIVGIIYWFLSYEDGGTMMLLGTCAMGLLPGAFYLYWHQRFHGHKYFFWGTLDRVVGDRPEDRNDATIEDGAGIIDSFPGSSIWPFILGMGAFLLALAMVFGIWLLPPAITLVLIAMIGGTVESRRGGHV
jgi:ABC-type antimicrobial peptide transport system permease subunit